MEPVKTKLEKQGSAYEIKFRQKLKTHAAIKEEIGDGASNEQEVSNSEQGQPQPLIRCNAIVGLASDEDIDEGSNKCQDVRGPVAAMRPLKFLMKLKSNFAVLKNDVDTIHEQNQEISEELKLHSETICKLLDMTNEKNVAISEIKTKNKKSQMEIEQLKDIETKCEALSVEMEEVKTRLATLELAEVSRKAKTVTFKQDQDSQCALLEHAKPSLASTVTCTSADFKDIDLSYDGCSEEDESKADMSSSDSKKKGNIFLKLCCCQS